MDKKDLKDEKLLYNVRETAAVLEINRNKVVVIAIIAVPNLHPAQNSVRNAVPK